MPAFLLQPFLALLLADVAKVVLLNVVLVQLVLIVKRLIVTEKAMRVVRAEMVSYVSQIEQDLLEHEHWLLL